MDKPKVNPSATAELLIHSELEENCTGWDGNTIFRFTNGQVWQQDTTQKRSLFLCCPDVSLWRVGSFFYLDVVGARDPLRVRRIQ